MTTHATAQRIGTRRNQCDATSTATDREVRAWALLDGIGDSFTVRAWTRDKARMLARVAAQTGSPEAAIAAVRAVTDYDGHGDDDEPPSAVAVVAVRTQDGELRIAWCGDSRAYWQAPGKEPNKLTADHNWAEMKRAHGSPESSIPRHWRNVVTSSLRRYDGTCGEVGTVGPLYGAGRLLLCSDGVYSPFEDNDAAMGPLMTAGTPRTAAAKLVSAALAFPAERHDNATALVADLG